MAHTIRISRFALVPALLCLLSLGCAAVSESTAKLAAAPVENAAALDRAVESFYSAKDAETMRAAVKSARLAAPESGRYHEIAAELARFELRDEDEFAHLVSAAKDTTYDQTALVLVHLDELTRSDEQQDQYLALLDALQTSHPDPRVRAQAAWLNATQRHIMGDNLGRDRAVKALSGALPLSVIGGWDNDQGKGFDVPNPPESGVDLKATYDGALMKIGWTAPPRDYRGETELRDYIAPDRWSVAYAASGFTLKQDGTYEVRLASSDPVKVFVDGTPVFEAREVEAAYMFDQFVIPVQLAAGDHQLFIKSAHRTGDWRLFARVTGENGVDANVKPAEAGEVAHALPGRPVLTDESMFATAPTHVIPAGARRARFEALYAAYAFAGSNTVREAQEFARHVPDSITARYALVSALWNNGERGRTADELSALDHDAGKDLVQIRMKQSRFWLQEGLKQRARKALLELAKAYPDRPAIPQQLAELYDSEKWNEDVCRTLESLNVQQPDTIDLQLKMASCWNSESRDDRSITLYRKLLSKRPRYYGVLWALEQELRDRGEFDEAIAVGKKLVDAYPTALSTRLMLAETYRRAGSDEQAMKTLTDARDAFPSSAEVLRTIASLSWRNGDKQTAIEAWQAALVRAPDDEATANRLDFVAPAAKGPWAADVPTDDDIVQALKLRESIKQAPGADLAYLLDHEVTELRPDGSTTNVVTTVVHAFNQRGRDKLTRQTLQYGGRIRVMQAYSIDTKGHRSEASVRSREVLYRGLDVGSTIVLQYRADAPPSGFLPRYLSKGWTFQAVNAQTRLAQFILWYPAGSPLHEVKVGELDRTEKKIGDETRVAWTMKDVAPFVPEPNSPPYIETRANVQLTTIPGWDTYKKWEDALLEGAFRDSPELDALAERLGNGATTAEEKLLRIHQFLMEDIRYQQDYESFIAGVKPHPASMVLERRYGDCKDKTVLFITLARKLGVKADFATVRTRGRGQVWKDLPTQQFDHAIVYVPAQPGFPEGRFFDSTADALDLDVVRDDDVGTQALVFDPDTRDHQWIPIPWQTPEHHSVRTQLAMSVKPDGSGAGDLTLSARGRVGSIFRQISRNPETFKQFMQMVTGGYFSGASSDEAQAVEVTNLKVPSVVKTRFFAPTAARKEGNELRMRLPTDWSPKQLFNLAQRHYALVLGTPSQQEWQFEIALPDGMRVTRLPTSGEVNTECISLRRQVAPTATGIAVQQSLEIRCERITPEQYPAYRASIEQMVRMLDEEVVMTKGKGIVKPARAMKD